MSKVRLGGLRVIQRTMTYSTPSRPESQLADLELTSRAISVLGSLVDNLVESRENVISELDLSNGRMPHRSDTNRKPCNTLLG